MKKALTLLALLGIFLISCVVWAQTTADGSAAEPDFFIAIGKLIVDYAQQGNWMPAASLLVLLGVVATRRFFWTSVPKRLVPLVAVAAAVAFQALGAILAGASPVNAIVPGLMTGLGATGLWEALGPKSDKKEEGSSSEE